MNENNMQKHGDLLPYSVIEAAADGNVDAISKVLKHYEGYIMALSTKRLYDIYGNTHTVVDTEMRRTLEIKLIVKIMDFDVTKIA